MESFSDSLPNDLKSAYTSFMSRNVLLVGEVYAPKINPLTGKVVGPEGKAKGTVKIIGESNGKLFVQKTFESAPFKVGVDVLSNIKAPEHLYINNGKVRFELKIWPTLQKISDKEPLTIRVPPTAAIVPEDCLPYNPTNLQVVNERAIGWLVTDGGSRMLKLANEADARDALALAKRYTAQCFIGRGNTRSNRKDYIIGYWE